MVLLQMNLETAIEIKEIKIQLIWYDHVQRITNKKLPKKLCIGPHKKNRMRVRPKITWTEGLRRSMSEGQLDDKDCTNRTSWQLGIG